MKKKKNSQESSEFLIRLVQEINSPLKTISLSSQKLLDAYKNKNFEYISYKDFKQLLLTLEQMNKQIQRCYQSAQEITGLDKSKIKQEFCDINEVINEVLKSFVTQFSKFKVSPYVRLNQKIPYVKLNKLDGNQIVHNIITNAIHAMPAGGGIRVRTSFEQKSKMVVIEISDDGVGISQQRLARIFEPFLITKEQEVEKSSGLGLSIVYSIVQGSGGSINIQSSLRKGTQVRIFLPALIV